jgi:hypothetical protein
VTAAPAARRSAASRAVSRRRTPVELAALAVGAVFLLVGIAGFIPGITTDYGDLGWADHDSTAKLLGLFMVSVLHNLVHIAFGVSGLALGRAPRTAKLYLIAGGFVYPVLWVDGLLIDQTSAGNFVPVNTADNWLHFALGAGMVSIGAALGTRSLAGERA